jgi:Protein of unknown function (DUF3105)
MTGRQRWLWRLSALAAAAVVVALVAAGPYRFVFGSVAGSAADRRDSPCLPGRAVEILDSPHISPDQARYVRYNSVPPTSGPHYALTIATGVYTSPLPDGLTVHALEHGHVAIQYAPGIPRDEVDALTSIARRYGDDVVLAPYSGLKAGIALTAWGRIEMLDRPDQARIATFVEALRGRYNHGWARPNDCPGGMQGAAMPNP